MSYSAILTTLGLAKVAAAIANKSTVKLTTMALGDGAGNPTTPSLSQTGLVREVYRASLNSLALDKANPSAYLIAEMVVPTTVGGWTVREFGIYDDTLTLIAVGNFPDTYKPLATEGSTRDLIIRVRIEVANTEAVTLQIDPSVVLASRQWVVDNFSIGALLPGGAAGDILMKKTATNGDVEWHDPTEGFTATIDAVEEHQVLSAGQTVVSLATVKTGAAAIYVDGLRLRGPESTSPQYAIDSTTQITLATAATAGQRLHAVENDPASPLRYLQKESLFAEIAAKGAVAQATARANLGVQSGDPLMSWIMNAIYPVGSIYTTASDDGVPPGLILAYGTWERFGAGRVLVGRDTNDSDFNAAGKTGGTKRVSLTAAEMPEHTHLVTPPATTTSTAGSHTHANGEFNRLLKVATGAGTVTGSLDYSAGEPDVSSGGNAEMQAAGAHNHTVNIAPFQSGAAGAGSGHSNVQPYIVVNMWRRTA